MLSQNQTKYPKILEDEEDDRSTCVVLEILFMMMMSRWKASSFSTFDWLALHRSVYSVESSCVMLLPPLRETWPIEWSRRKREIVCATKTTLQRAFYTHVDGEISLHTRFFSSLYADVEIHEEKQEQTFRMNIKHKRWCVFFSLCLRENIPVQKKREKEEEEINWSWEERTQRQRNTYFFKLISNSILRINVRTNERTNNVKKQNNGKRRYLKRREEKAMVFFIFSRHWLHDKLQDRHRDLPSWHCPLCHCFSYHSVDQVALKQDLDWVPNDCYYCEKFQHVDFLPTLWYSSMDELFVVQHRWF